MEKPERLLYIYTRFLNGKNLNKEKLAQDLKVNVRTIQRDLSDINHFIYEDHEWQGLEGKIIYDYDSEHHRLKVDRYKFRNNRLLNLLFRMKSFTPVIHEDTYNLIRGLNANSNLAEKLLSNKLLSQFKIYRETSNSTFIFRIQLAIENQNFISLQISPKQRIKVIPIYTRYFNHQYWFSYLYQNQAHSMKVSSILDLDQIEEMFDQDIFFKTKSATLLVSDELWSEFYEQFIIIHKEQKHNGTLVDVIVSKEECLQIAYDYPQDIILLKPQTYVDDFKTKIRTLFDNYNI